MSKTSPLLLIGALLLLGSIGCNKTEGDVAAADGAAKSPAAAPAPAPSGPLTVDEYIEKGNPVYKGWFDAQGDMTGGVTVSDVPDDLSKQIDLVVKNLQAKGDALRALQPPAELKEGHDQMVAMIDPVVKVWQKAEDAAKSGDKKAIDEGSAESSKVRQPYEEAATKAFAKAGLDGDAFSNDYTLKKK